MRIRRPISFSATLLVAMALIAGFTVLLVGFFWLIGVIVSVVGAAFS